MSPKPRLARNVRHPRGLDRWATIRSVIAALGVLGCAVRCRRHLFCAAASTDDCPDSGAGVDDPAFVEVRALRLRRSRPSFHAEAALRSPPRPRSTARRCHRHRRAFGEFRTRRAPDDHPPADRRSHADVKALLLVPPWPAISRRRAVRRDVEYGLISLVGLLPTSRRRSRRSPRCWCSPRRRRTPRVPRPRPARDTRSRGRSARRSCSGSLGASISDWRRRMPQSSGTAAAEHDGSAAARARCRDSAVDDVRAEMFGALRPTRCAAVRRRRTAARQAGRRLGAARRRRPRHCRWRSAGRSSSSEPDAEGPRARRPVAAPRDPDRTVRAGRVVDAPGRSDKGVSCDEERDCLVDLGVLCGAALVVRAARADRRTHGSVAMVAGARSPTEHRTPPGGRPSGLRGGVVTDENAAIGLRQVTSSIRASCGTFEARAPSGAPRSVDRHCQARDGR